MATGARVMVVEDEAIVADDLQSTLERLGYQVTSVESSGEAALEAAVRGLPDLVLMDIRLAGLMDGVETAARIRKHREIAIVYLTSHSDEATLQRAKKTAAHGFLIKPFDERELRAALEIALHKQQADIKVLEREQWLYTTLRSIGDAVIATDAEQRVKFMNGVAEDLVGWAANDARGQPIDEVLRLQHAPTGTLLQNPLHVALRDRVRVDMPPDTLVRRRDGSEILIEDSAAPILGERGELLGGVIVFRDVTEPRALDQRLRISERMASVGLLAAGVAHEVNNPLAYVLANAEYAAQALTVLQSRAPGETQAFQELHQVLSEITEGATRIRAVVRDLRTMAADEGDGQTSTSVVAAAETALRLTQNRWHGNARLERAYAADPRVYASESRLIQVLVNLVLNAVDAMEGSARPQKLRIEIAAHGRQVRLTVSDTGRGIDPSHLPRIFDPFFTTRATGSGMGLGLSICHSIVSKLGGTIEATSEVGVGTSIRVTLPALAEA